MSYIGNTVQNQNYVPAIDYFNGDGSTVAFTLSRPVASVAAVQAVISNVPQNPGSAFTVSGSTITFTSAPPSGTANIYVYYTSPNTQVVQPGQGTVGSSQIASGVNLTAGTITFADSSTISSHAAPQVTVYTSGSGTYTTPTGAKYLTVKMVGGGAGGRGSGTSNGSLPGNGGNTTFGSSYANGGQAPTLIASAGGRGGAASISGGSGIAVSGGQGGPTVYNAASGCWSAGGQGGSSALGGAGGGGSAGSSGNTAVAATGGGGGGGGTSGFNGNSGPGGGAGGYVDMVITSPSATYSYAVGAAGTYGSAGGSGYDGGSGSGGSIYITAYF